MYLNLVLEFVPETVYRVARRYSRQKETIPILFVKVSDRDRDPSRFVYHVLVSLLSLI